MEFSIHISITNDSYLFNIFFPLLNNFNNIIYSLFKLIIILRIHVLIKFNIDFCFKIGKSTSFQ